jgi:predicted ATPase with chaperone activity
MRSEQLQLSARAFLHARSVTLRVARTIADLAGSADIAPAHTSTLLRASLAETIHLRQAEKARVVVRAFKHLICWS